MARGLAVLVVALIAIQAFHQGCATHIARSPRQSAGEWWTYDFSFKNVPTPLGPMGGSGTMTLRVTASQTRLDGVREDLVELSTSGSGDYSGPGIGGQTISGKWSQTGKQFVTIASLAIAKVVSELSVTYADNSYIRTDTYVYSPPLERYLFPLSAGAAWSVNVNERHTYGVPGQTPTSTTSSVVRQMTCVSQENLTVPAGRFQVLRVYALDSSGNYSDDYFSPEAKTSIKSQSFTAGGESVSKMELREFGGTPVTRKQEALVLWVFVIAGVCLVFIAVYRVVRRARSERPSYRPAKAPSRRIPLDERYL